MIIWVKRGNLPDWYDTAIDANNGSNVAANELKHLKIHASETAWVGTEFDSELENNSSIDELYLKIESLVKNQQQDHLVSI
jgi:hypothetical protein